MKTDASFKLTPLHGTVQRGHQATMDFFVGSHD